MGTVHFMQALESDDLLVFCDYLWRVNISYYRLLVLIKNWLVINTESSWKRVLCFLLPVVICTFCSLGDGHETDYEYEGSDNEEEKAAKGEIMYVTWFDHSLLFVEL